MSLKSISNEETVQFCIKHQLKTKSRAMDKRKKQTHQENTNHGQHGYRPKGDLEAKIVSNVQKHLVIEDNVRCK